MAQLTVSVSGSHSESQLLTLPVDVFAPDGVILASGTASPDQPAHFELKSRPRCKLDRVYVLGRLPNGTTVQETAEFHDGQAMVTLHPSEESPHEWLEWVTPFHSLNHLRPSNQLATTSRRIGKVWMTLWSLRDGRWESEGVQADDRLRDNGMRQFVIDVPPSPHLLQIGGEEVAWRLISLPPGGPVRVALTRTAAEQGDALEITVGRTQPDNGLIMSYLARGAFADANRLAEAWHVADQMLYKKKSDPISAAAGAYLLLKNRRLQDRRSWVDNLVDWFPYMADGAIVSAALALQREDANESEIRSKINMALSRGLPVFAMGASLLVETMAAVHRGKDETKRFHAAYLAAQAYARARCINGAYFAFNGKSPAEPSWAPIYGLEGEATNTPLSADPTKIVVYARPLDGIQAGKFGSTRVVLPRAPVSPELVIKLLAEVNQVDKEFATAPAQNPRRPWAEPPLFRSTVIRGIPMLETNFLQEFSVSSVRGTPQEASEGCYGPRLEPQVKLVEERGTKSVRRQTAKFWRDERLKHAMTIFEGNE